jgi:hypothetical protein
MQTWILSLPRCMHEIATDNYIPYKCAFTKKKKRKEKKRKNNAEGREKIILEGCETPVFFSFSLFLWSLALALAGACMHAWGRKWRHGEIVFTFLSFLAICEELG